MKRLTIREGGEASPANGLSSGVLWEIVDHLASIEDILGDEYDLERLRELAQVDREGKIYPKYTIGETIYDRFGEFWTVDTVELHSLYTKNEWLYRCGHDGTDDYCALWEFESFPSKEAALRREQDEKGGEPE